MSDLLPVSISLNAENRSLIWINDAFHATMKRRSHMHELIVYHSLIYVSHNLTTMYLSYDIMVALGVVKHDFSMVGQFNLSPIPHSARNHHLCQATWQTTLQAEFVEQQRSIDKCANAPSGTLYQISLQLFLLPVQVKIMIECIIGSLTTMAAQRLTPAATKHFPSWQGHLLKFILRRTWHQLQSTRPFLFQSTGKGKSIVIYCVTSRSA